MRSAQIHDSRLEPSDPRGPVVNLRASGQVLVPSGLVAAPLRPSAVSVLDTTELRWFMAGPLPADVHRWFSGSTAFTQKRCDTYLLNGRADIGIKRRFREILELKIRRSHGESIELSDGLTGPLDVWRKWSPADDLTEDTGAGRWKDVHKSIVKRRFWVDGTEIDLSAGPKPTAAGCDIEIAAVTVGSVQAWTFAFAAFGPYERRWDALVHAWQQLLAASPCPDQFGPRNGLAMGYPEWLALTS